MMLRRLTSGATTAALGIALTSHNNRQYHATTPNLNATKSFATNLLCRTPICNTNMSSPKVFTAPSPQSFWGSHSSASHVQSRRYLTKQTAVNRIRVQGRDLTQRDVPQYTGSSGGGSQADSLTPHVREHLTRVYTLLASGCAVAGLGSLLMIASPLAKVVPFWLPMAAGFVPLLWLSFAPPANPTAKLALFYSFTVLEGMAIAPLVLMTSMKGVLVTSLVLTGAIFCGFSAAAYLAPRASLVAWQGPLFGALIGMVALSFLNVFYPTAIAHSIILYGGLALFSVMVSVDTQAMIERARCGAGDHVQDAMQMFLNVLNIFIRIAQMMGMSNN